VVADETGVVILPVANLEEVVAKARARQEREAKLMEGLRGGKTTLELLALTPLLDDLQQK
jgi:4-hydroxy-4-methyl-2-oxoglutarate aldolase